MQINLLPDLVIKKRREAEIKRYARLALTAWLGVLVFAVISTVGYQIFQNVTLEAAKKEHAELDSRVNSPDNVAFRKEALAVQASLNAVKDLFNNQRRLSVAISRVSELTPKGVRLSEVNIGEEGQLTVTGTAGSYAEAGKMVVALRNSKDKAKDGQPYFEKVVLTGANQANAAVAFSITANYVSEGGASSESR